MTLEQLSTNSLLIAFILFNLSFVGFVIAVAGKRWSRRDPASHSKKWGRRSYALAIIGLAFQLVFFFARWIDAGHIPTSNMFEFMTFLGMMIMTAFIIIFAIYRSPVLGAFAMPVGVIILAYASVFPREVQPLIPALKSYWLYIHVSTAAAGEAFFAVGFATGLMYLIRTVSYTDATKKARRARRGVETVLYAILVVVSFVILVSGFGGAGYQAQFKANTAQSGMEQTVDYTLPPIIAPHDSSLVHMDSFLGLNQPLFEAPPWMKGESAGRKFNTVVWSLLAGLLLYWLIRLLARRPLGRIISPIMNDIDPEDLDEISYRAIAIGFPIFTLGALIFAMIWASEAWGRFWGFDPKETWALITWLFYTLYLHLRLSRGWQGSKASWLSVIGFVIVMFTLIAVNLVIAGLHSYAGV